MKEILETIIKNLVTEVDSVSINESNKENEILYEIKVAEKDMGRVIGREGKVAKSIRTIIKAISAKEKKKVTIEFLD